MKKRKAVLLLCFLAAILLVNANSLCLYAEEEQRTKADDQFLKKVDEDHKYSKANKARNGVVRVFSDFGDGSCGTGSGFGIGKKGEETQYFITNWHVVYNQNTRRICDDVYILLDNDAVTMGFLGAYEPHLDHMVACEVLGSPKQYPDFAILKAKKKIKGRVALPLWSADNVEPLDTVIALGYPGTADQINGNKFLYADVDNVNATNGNVNRVTKLHEAGDTRCVIHDASINHGNSGGPLVTTEGAVVGINTYGSVASDDGLTSTYNSSVCIDYVMDELDKLGIKYDVYQPEKDKKESTKEPEGSGKSDGKDDSSDEKEKGGSGGIILLFLLIIALGGSVGGIIFLRQKSKNKEKDDQIRQMKAEVDEVISKLKKMEEVGPDHGEPAHWQEGFRLQGVNGIYAGKRFALEDYVVMGVDASQCNLVFPKGHAGISRRHLELKVEDNQVYLRDLGSTYGTFCNNTKLAPYEWIRLYPGDAFWLASEEECFALDTSNR